MLLDPCRGSGAILGEAVAAGWTATGPAIDPAAMTIARRNVTGVTVAVGDVLVMGFWTRRPRVCRKHAVKRQDWVQ